ncbi:MAG: hypothetical protein HUJ67_05160, partial [Ruminiclostridium sp.]|nr:hypothetical protein [Ruminiclostridium sp.]
MVTCYPDYYPAFGCTASRCKHNCCIGWEIDIDPVSLARYQAAEGPMGERLHDCIAQGKEPHFILGEEERCPFLNGENLCDLILYGGEEMLCQICTDHPRFRNFLPGRTEIGVGLCCEAAAHLILSQQDPVRLCFGGEPEGETEDGEELLEARDLALAIAQNRSIPVTRREDWLLEAFGCRMPDLTPARWAEFLLGLERMDEGWTARLEALRNYGADLDLDAFGAHMEDRQTEYEQLLVYFLYRHFPAAYEDGDMRSKVAFAVLSVR